LVQAHQPPWGIVLAPLVQAHQPPWGIVLAQVGLVVA
jgi:hypothetical protein